MRIIDLGEEFYHHEKLERFPRLKRIAVNQTLLDELDLTIDQLDELRIEDYSPISLAYAGHQFGHFVPQLGDGRACLINERMSKNGKTYDIQLKGSGRTQFSRRGDGKSSLGPVLREYLLSEAMHTLQVPTTRSLAAYLTGETVYREEAHPGGLFIRVANTHLRVGTFQYFACRQDFESIKKLIKLANTRHQNGIADEDYRGFFKDVLERQINLVTKWLSLGFIHGVMNTDNTSISGETIDYGPCAFMDNFSQDRVFSFIDRQGRYRYQNQKNILFWNMARLAECIFPFTVVDDNHEQLSKEINQMMKEGIEQFDQLWLKRMGEKLGIKATTEEHRQLVEDFLTLLEENDMDFTESFYRLEKNRLRHFEERKGWKDFYQRWQSHSPSFTSPTNPNFIMRNHLVELAIEKAYENDFSLFQDLLEASRQPFEEFEQNKFLVTPPRAEERVKNTFCGT